MASKSSHLKTAEQYGKIAALTREVEALSQLGASLQPLLWKAQGLKTLTYDAPDVDTKSPGKDKKKAKEVARKKSKQKPYEPSQQAAFYSQVDPEWTSLVQEAWGASHRLNQISTITDVLPTLLSALGPGAAKDLRTTTSHLEDWSKSPFRRQALEVLREHGYDPMIIDFVDRRLSKSSGDLLSLIGAKNINSLIKQIGRTAEPFRKFVQNQLALAGSESERKKALAPLSLSGNPEIKIDCSWLKGDAETICIIVGIIIIVITIVVLVVQLIGSWIDWMNEDDEARDWVNKRSCGEIATASNKTLRGQIERMMSGFTGDADENAILRILNCLPCDRVRDIVNEIGPGELLDEFQGAEWDRIIIRYQECGLASFRDFDDDATRRFVGSVSCGVISRLTEDDVRQLMFNLFDGATGDDDERAILRIVNCRDCAQLRSLVRRGGMSPEDFDDEVDGAEWRELAERFTECGIEHP
jgi:hypothetical protein